MIILNTEHSVQTFTVQRILHMLRQMVNFSPEGVVLKFWNFAFDPQLQK